MFSKYAFSAMLYKIAPTQFDKYIFKKATGKKLNLKSPKTFNEKIQWLKLYEVLPIKTKLADKYSAREWVEEKIGKKYLVPLVGVWDNLDDIDFSKLPEKFAIKGTHGSGWVEVVTDKNTINEKKLRSKMKMWLGRNYAYHSVEKQYEEIKPRIMAEAYCPCDHEYQFWCFNGEPKFVSVIDEPHGKNEKATYDMSWNQQDFVTSLPKMKEKLKRPKDFEEMKKLASILCEGFTFVRVDFLHDESNIWFGEMTFSPASGCCKWKPEKYDKIIGEWIKLPNEKVKK